MHFEQLGVHAALLPALQRWGALNPSPVQAQAIPVGLRRCDVWATAPTGSGKTVAFAVPLVQGLAGAGQPPLARPARARGRRLAVRGLVLVPTRELAAQVGQVVSDLAQALGLRVVVAYGGVSINPQMMALRGGADVVVATPGRLLDLLQHQALGLAQLQCLVLDEADRLLDAGFAQEWAAVRAQLPERRQTLLFSATDAPVVQELAHSLLHEPVRVTVQAVAAQAPQIRQRAIAVDAHRRTALLRQLVADSGCHRVLVFVATRHACEHVANKLYQAGLFATAFHGEMSQGARQDVLNAFKAGRWEVVVTTDLAARGLDIVDLPMVVNYDLPRSATDYTHRIGRTGRAGAQGQAVSFVTAAGQAHWGLIRRREQLDVPLEVLPGFEPTEAPPPPAPGNGGIKGKRPSKKDKLRAAAAARSAP